MLVIKAENCGLKFNRERQQFKKANNETLKCNSAKREESTVIVHLNV